MKDFRKLISKNDSKLKNNRYVLKVIVFSREAFTHWKTLSHSNYNDKT